MKSLRWVGYGFCVGAGAALAAVNLLDYDFNLWDNFQTFTPNTLHAHGLWLEGHVPLLNLHQNLGQTILGNGQSGALYWPYTLMLRLVRLFGFRDQALPQLSGVFHCGWATAGWVMMLRNRRVSDPIALIAAVGIVGGGFITRGAAIWQHVAAEYAWFPWVWWLLLDTIDHGATPRRWLALGAAWFTLAAGSHVQQLIYVSLHLALFSLIYARAIGRGKRAAATLLGLSVLLVSTAFPSLVYALAALSRGQRAAPLSDDIFYEAGLSPAHFWGILSPFVPTGPGFFGLDDSYACFVGAWLVVGLATAFLPSARRAASPFLITAVIFADLSLGRRGWLLPLTRHVPVWSSFRWAYKFTPHWTAALGAAAAVGLESFFRWSPRYSRLAVAGTALAVPALLGIPFSPWLMALWLIPVVMWLGAAHPGLLLPLATAYLVTCFGFAGRHFAPRYFERYGEYGTDFFGVEPDSRVAALSNPPSDQLIMQPLGILDAATVNDYLALGGHQMGMSAHEMATLVSSHVNGVLSPWVAERAVGRGLYRSLGVRYYVLATADLPAYQNLLQRRGLQPHRVGAGWSVYRDAGASALISVPDRARPAREGPTHPFGTDADQTAWVEGLTASIYPSATRVSVIEVEPGRGLAGQIENNSGRETLVQFSLFPWPFVRALVDDKPAEAFVSNQVATAVKVPPGVHRVEVSASVDLLIWSLLAAGLVTGGGAVILARGRPEGRSNLALTRPGGPR